MHTSKQQEGVMRRSQVEGGMPGSIVWHITIREAYKIAITGVMQHSKTMAIEMIDVRWSHVMKRQLGKTDDCRKKHCLMLMM